MKTETLKFGDIARLRKDTINPKELEDIKYLGLEHINKESLSINSIGSSKGLDSNKFVFSSDDVLFGKLRPYFRKVFKPKFDGICSTDIWVVQPRDSNICKDFLFYLMADQKFVDFANQGATGTRMPRADWNHVVEYEVKKFTYEEQNQISKILRPLDNKIELNQKMNETIEDIAKTLFKSWFIDFDPVRAKAEGRPTGLSKEISDLFPDAFEDSELGEIPRGWKLSNLDSNLEFVLGGDWGKEEPSDDFNKEVVCIRGADIPNLQTFIESNPPKRFIKESSLEKRKLKEGDLVLEISGGSPTQSTGRIVYITEEFLSTKDCPVVFSNFCRILRSDSTLSKYIYYYLRSLYDSDKLFQYETGTTGIKNFGYKYFSEEVFFALPNFDLLTIFSELIETFLIKKGTNLKEIITLTNLRDILLPKLISGELKIHDAENLVEKAGI